MIRMMVGLMGRAALISISSKVMPMTDRSTMARSSWFHLPQAHARTHARSDEVNRVARRLLPDYAGSDQLRDCHIS